MWAAKPRETQNLEEKQGISLSLIHTSGGVEGGADPRVLSDVEKQHLFVRQQKKAKEKNACMIQSLFVACVMPVVRERERDWYGLPMGEVDATSSAAAEATG